MFFSFQMMALSLMPLSLLLAVAFTSAQTGRNPSVYQYAGNTEGQYTGNAEGYMTVEA